MSKQRQHPRRRLPRIGWRAAGTVLIVAMWIILALVGLVLVLARAMRVEGGGSANGAAQAQAAAIEQGAIQYVLAHLSGLNGSTPSELDAPGEAIRVGDGACWILHPSDDGRTYAFGITDESGKLNLNTAAAAMLLKLPGMTTELADSIVDWRDSDGDVTAEGAESQYYLLLNDPYECKNAPLETVEELWLIRGITPQIFFGEDTNRNGVLDDNENDGALSDPPDNADGRLDRGIWDFVTVYSARPRASASSVQLINVNDTRGSELSDLLRQVLSPQRVAPVLDRIRRARPFQNLLDFFFRSGLTEAEFHQIAGAVATESGRNSAALVNVNTAPREVLACVPRLEESDVAALLSWRSEPGRDLSTIAWVAQALPREKALAVADYLTTQSYRFSADIVAVAGDGRAFRRCRIVVDATSSPPKLLYWQDLTHLGWPLPPDIIVGLRSGLPLDRLVPAYQQGVW